MAEQTTSTGVVVRFNTRSGFGFVKPDEGGADVFVHHTVILGQQERPLLREGDKVEFTYTTDEAGKRKADRCTAPGGQPVPLVETPEDRKSRKQQRDSKKVDYNAIQTQVEFYLGDDNLKTDKWMRDLIGAGTDGYVPIEKLLNLAKLKALTFHAKEVVTALSGSKVLEVNAAEDAVRRKSPLPDYVPPMYFELTEIPDGVIWKDIKAVAENLFGTLVTVHVAGAEDADKTNFLQVAPLKDGVEAAKEKIVAEGVKSADGKVLAKANLVTGEGAEKLDALSQKLKNERHQKQTNKRKGGDAEGAANKRPKNEKKVTLAGREFTKEEVITKVKAIFRANPEGDVAIEGKEHDFLLDLLKYHTKSEEKLKDLKQVILADNAAHKENGSRCFYVVRNDGTREDFSYIKCASAAFA